MTAFLSDIYHICWRDMRRFFSQRSRILLTLVQPLIWLVLMGNIMSGMTRSDYGAGMLSGARYIDFMTPGIMIMTALFNGTFCGFSLVWDRRFGFLYKMLVAPVSRVAIPVGKMTATAIQIGLQVIIIGIIAHFMHVHFSAGILGFLMIVTIAGIFSFAMAGVSLSIAIHFKTLEGVHPILNFISMPLMFTSNAVFPKAAMPDWMQVICDWNPLTHAITPMRTLVVEGWVWDQIIPGLAFNLTFALVMVLVSTMQFRRAIG
ncbi:ABC2-type transporter, permease protein [Desulfosarcina variabilis str. Montpellier]|uniref:ABC transporter permease n=1 Tax=Desulfosarcina variabilis TaxID=2300 RepID=UPI003AFA8626